MSLSLGVPRYFIVGARPVRLVPQADGGLDVEAIDWTTGEFRRDLSYLSRVLGHDTDVDEVTEDEFERHVALIRGRLGNR